MLPPLPFRDVRGRSYIVIDGVGEGGGGSPPQHRADPHLYPYLTPTPCIMLGRIAKVLGALTQLRVNESAFHKRNALSGEN